MPPSSDLGLEPAGRSYRPYMDPVYDESLGGAAAPATGELVPLWKRVLDIALIICALPVVFPISLGLAILIRCVSAGPILFRQERVGLKGRTFMCFKFRTMYVDADKGVHEGHLEKLMNSGKPMVKMDTHGDPRVIPCGAIVRSSGLDEIPQLLNVLRGEMSIVGPRPCLPFEAKKYLPWQRERFDTLPGLTGLWQVSGKNRTTFDEMISLDIAYARKKNPWLDFKIMIKTPIALLKQMLETKR